LYHALKAFGQILKSIFILRVIDEPGLRMSIEKALLSENEAHASKIPWVALLVEQRRTSLICSGCCADTWNCLNSA
jgi:hypothetical protein